MFGKEFHSCRGFRDFQLAFLRVGRVPSSTKPSNSECVYVRERGTRNGNISILTLNPLKHVDSFAATHPGEEKRTQQLKVNTNEKEEKFVSFTSSVLERKWRGNGNMKNAGGRRES